ncbi:hypothetical protein [Sphingomonas lenta]|uniref:Uncharacterized protein n=1 Tax=Sphingomonas lenta TaxID=1141887 RepID=A0A2A2SJA7_9SPHN|nr:hypothetical protein [Sphingomonas lenta]PAX09357.1 hypothetical protein CKY28_00955 [Sphingomonas lenta]
MFVRITAALAAVLLPAAARADWRHELSGVTVPDVVGDMCRGAERRVEQDGSDIFVQYGTDAEPATLYVYRSSHPNPALWFERTRIAMLGNVGAFDGSAAPRPFTLGLAGAPNGLRGAFALPGRPWKSTAVAIAQHGEWLVKARVTSQTLDPAGAAKRMDALLAAIRFADAPKSASLPLTAPAACADAATFAGKPTTDDKLRGTGAAVGVVALAEAHGAVSGLAGKPDEWCREEVGELAKAVTYYRKRDGSAWTALLGDAGVTASAYAFPEGVGAKGAAVYLNRTGPALLVETYDAMPDLRTGAGAALAVMAGQRKPLASIGTKPKS